MTNTTSIKTSQSRWMRYVVWALCLAFLCYLPVVLTDRAVLGVRLSNMQLLNLGMSQVNLMLIAMLGAMSLNYLTGCAGLISIGHAAFYATGAMTAAITVPYPHLTLPTTREVVILVRYVFLNKKSERYKEVRR